MSWGVPVRNGLAVGLLASTTLSSGRGVYPVPSMSLDFLQPYLDSRITFTRGSNATFVGSNGLIQTAAIDAPRFDYNPVTLAPRGLLIEEQRTNLLTYSEQFDNAAWGKVQIAATANATASPDGTTTADRLTPDAGLVTPYVFQAATTTASAFTVSVYVKASGYNFVQLSDGVSATDYCNFDLSTGAVGASSGYTGSITNAGNGWYRCAATKTFTAVSTEICIEPLATNLASRRPNYTADGTSSIFIWGAQLEAGAFATSYIPTVASQVTRSADAVSMTGTNFSAWYNQSEGTFVAGVTYLNASSTAWTYTAHSGTAASTNSYIAAIKNSAAIIRHSVVAAGVSQGNIDLGTATAGTIYKTAGAYKANDVAFSVNGATPGVDTTVTLPSPNALAIGNLFNQYLNGHIRSVSYYPARLSDTQLQSLTT